VTTPRVWLSRILDVILRRRRDARLSDEINAHLGLLADEYQRRGWSPHDARLAARRDFGGVDQIAMTYRDQRGLPLVDALTRDISYALRMMGKNRWFTAATVLVLALGIGVNTTVFTIVNGMNLRGLPVTKAEQILMIESLELEGRRRQMSMSYPDFRDVQSATHTFQGLAAYSPAPMNVGDADRPADRLAGFFVTANAFGLLGVPPLLGRHFSANEERPGAAPVALLTHAVWSDRYLADPAIVGQRIRVNGTPTTVIGVMPEGFRFPVRADIWQPLGQLPGLATQTRNDRSLWVFGRLTDAATLEQARAEINTIASALAAEYPDTNTAVGARIVPFTQGYVGGITEGPPVVLMAAGVLVLLIACANVASLLLARATTREREIALRVAIGASRARVMRQLLVESVMLATIAGAFGLIIATTAIRLFAAYAVDLNLPYWIHFGFDARVFGYVAAICLATAMVCGFAPAWQLSKAHPHDALKAGRAHGTGPRSERWANGLLIGELALTLVLLTSATLLVRSGLALYRADEAITAGNLMTAQLAMPRATYATADARRAFHLRLQEHLDAEPAIAAATLASARPFTDSVSMQLVFEGERPATDNRRVVQMVAVGPRYFETLGLSMLRGRSLTPTEDRPGEHVVIINERFASLHFANANPIGARIQLAELEATAGDAEWLTIIGVSPSVRQRPMGPAAAVAYLPLAARPGAFTSVVFRGAGTPVTAVDALRQQLRAVDSDVAAYNIEPLRRLSEKSRWNHRMMSALLTVFAVIATILSAAGLYAMTAYGVAQRTSEIGVRMALGAERSQVAWLFMRRTMWQLTAGLLLGTAGAVAAGQVIRGVLVQTSPNDPLTFIGIALFLLVVAAVACSIPTRHATRLDPVAALRHQ
jgi:predicted permease